MKKLIALIFPFLFSCQQGRIDLPKSIVEGAWNSCIGSFVFYSKTGECRFNSPVCSLTGKYYIAERTIIINFDDDSIMRLIVRHYDSQYITCYMQCLRGTKPVTLIKA